MKIVLEFFCVFVIFAAIDARDATSNYCQMPCPDPLDKRIIIPHVACGYQGKFDAAACIKPRWVEMTAELKKLIVDLHNAERNLVAGGGAKNHPHACKMPTVSWDEDLAFNAGALAYKCHDDHDKCHNTAKFKHSGQNLYMLFSTDPNFNNVEVITGGIQGWASEKNNSNAAIISSYPSNRNKNLPMIGHFTVMVADHNTHVGCAAATYVYRESPEYTEYLFICNYASTNIVKRPIYDSKCNAPAEKCTSGKNSKYPNLCSEKEKVDPNAY